MCGVHCWICILGIRRHMRFPWFLYHNLVSVSLSSPSISSVLLDSIFTVALVVLPHPYVGLWDGKCGYYVLEIVVPTGCKPPFQASYNLASIRLLDASYSSTLQWVVLYLHPDLGFLAHAFLSISPRVWLNFSISLFNSGWLAVLLVFFSCNNLHMSWTSWL